jgi:alpha-D-ribose 1-methylphosphonate 5-triphosphate synthase subunit PhnH
MSELKKLSAGFSDPVHEAQHAFKQALDALSMPGRSLALGQQIEGLSLGPAMAQLLLALSDDETPVWWQSSPVSEADWLRFHTGATKAEKAEEASFAVITNAALAPALSIFSSGSSESPEQSSTLLIEVPAFDTGPAITLYGPGIETTQTVRIAGLPDDFWSQWSINHASFPQGVDIIFTSGCQALGLPRSTRARRLEEI